MIFKWREQR